MTVAHRRKGAARLKEQIDPNAEGFILSFNWSGWLNRNGAVMVSHSFESENCTVTASRHDQTVDVTDDEGVVDSVVDNVNIAYISNAVVGKVASVTNIITGTIDGEPMSERFTIEMEVAKQ